MRSCLGVLLWCLVFCGVRPIPVFAADEDWRVELLNQRYDDFFAHRKQEREFNKKREAGVPEVLKENARWDKQMEIAAREFTRNRPPPPNLDAAYREWAASQKKFDDAHERAREQYVRVQNRIEALEKTAKKIPENLEWDLDNRYE